VTFFYKQMLRVCLKVKIIATESHHASWISSQNAALSGWQKWRWKLIRDRSHLCYKSIINYDLDITNILVVSPQVRYIEVFDTSNPRFNEQTYPVPSDFVKSRFRCNSCSCLFPCYPWLLQLQQASQPIFGKSDSLLKFKISVTGPEFADWTMDGLYVRSDSCSGRSTQSGCLWNLLCCHKVLAVLTQHYT